VARFGLTVLVAVRDADGEGVRTVFGALWTVLALVAGVDLGDVCGFLLTEDGLMTGSDLAAGFGVVGRMLETDVLLAVRVGALTAELEMRDGLTVDFGAADLDPEVDRLLDLDEDEDVFLSESLMLWGWATGRIKPKPIARTRINSFVLFMAGPPMRAIGGETLVEAVKERFFIPLPSSSTIQTGTIAIRLLGPKPDFDRALVTTVNITNASKTVHHRGKYI
jgi:hypothetical protein